jgi:hypothetical protein
MNLTEVQALITYVNQIDARIQVNMPTAEVWHMSLNKYPLDHARYAAMTYYAYTSSDDGSGMPALTPGILRRRVAEHMEHAQGKARAKKVTEIAWDKVGQAAIERDKTDPNPDGTSRYEQLIAQAKGIAKPIPD